MTAACGRRDRSDAYDAKKMLRATDGLAQLLERKPAKITTVVLANKTARIAWAVMSRNGVYAASAA